MAPRKLHKRCIKRTETENHNVARHQESRFTAGKGEEKREISPSESTSVLASLGSYPHFDELSIAPDPAFQGERVLESIESAFGLGFFDETDDGVDEQDGLWG